MAAAVDASERLELAGVMTHFATADDQDSDFFDEQLRRFRPFAEELKRSHPGCIAHAANSAAVLRSETAHFDMARCGIAVYGMDPFGDDPALRGLEPALALHSYVAEVKVLSAGESVGYGRTWVASEQHERCGPADRLRRRLPARPFQLGGRADPRASLSRCRDDQHGQHHGRGGRRRGRGGRLRDADRGRRRRARDRRGAGSQARHDQLRDHLRRLGARAARAPGVP